jgi:hypothetical protein
LKEELSRMWKMKSACIIPLVLPITGVIPNKSYGSLRVPNLLPAVRDLLEKTITLNTCSIVRKLWAEQ